MKSGGNSNKLSGAIDSGADPASYGKRDDIPQDVKKRSWTSEMFEAFFDYDRDGVRENDKKR